MEASQKSSTDGQGDPNKPELKPLFGAQVSDPGTKFSFGSNSSDSQPIFNFGTPTHSPVAGTASLFSKSPQSQNGVSFPTFGEPPSFQMKPKTTNTESQPTNAFSFNLAQSNGAEPAGPPALNLFGGFSEPISTNSAQPEPKLSGGFQFANSGDAQPALFGGASQSSGVSTNNSSTSSLKEPSDIPIFGVQLDSTSEPSSTTAPSAVGSSSLFGSNAPSSFGTLGGFTTESKKDSAPLFGSKETSAPLFGSQETPSPLFGSKTTQGPIFGSKNDSTSSIDSGSSLFGSKKEPTAMFGSNPSSSNAFKFSGSAPDEASAAQPTLFGSNSQTSFGTQFGAKSSLPEAEGKVDDPSFGSSKPTKTPLFGASNSFNLLGQKDTETNSEPADGPSEPERAKFGNASFGFGGPSQPALFPSTSATVPSSFGNGSQSSTTLFGKPTESSATVSDKSNSAESHGPVSGLFGASATLPASSFDKPASSSTFSFGKPTESTTDSGVSLFNKPAASDALNPAGAGASLFSNGTSLFATETKPSDSGMGFSSLGREVTNNDLISFATTEDDVMSGVETSVPEFELEDAPIPAGEVKLWNETNRTLKFSFSSTTNSGLVWIDKSELDAKRARQYKHALVQEEDLKLYPTEAPFNGDYSTVYEELVAKLFEILGECKQALHDAGLDGTEPKRRSIALGTFRGAAGEQQRKSAVCQPFVAKFVEAVDTTVDLIPDDNRGLLDALYIVAAFLAVKFPPSSLDQSFGTVLSDWACRVDVGLSVDDVAEIMGTNPPTAHPHFWRFVQDNVNRGLLDAAAASLRAAVKENALPIDATESAEFTIKLLKSYPDGHNQHKFPQWRAECLNALEMAKEINDTQLRLEICRVLSTMTGDTATILDTSGSWMVALVALTKFRDSSRTRLPEYFQTVTNVIPVDTTLDWEAGCAAVVSGNLLSAIQKIESLDLALAATMTEFCQISGFLDEYQDIYGEFEDGKQPFIRDWLVLSHGQNCLVHEGMAEIGVQMLLELGTPAAKQTIAEVLPRIEVHSAEQLEWLLWVARSLGLHHTESQIHRLAARTHLASHRYVDALVELDAAEDVVGLRAYVWRVFEEMLVQNSVTGDDITRSVLAGDSDIELSARVRECLAPLAVLATYIDASSKRDYASDLVALVRFTHLPSRFYGAVVAMLLPVLDEEATPPCSSSELVAVMSVLDMWKDHKANFAEGLDVMKQCGEAGAHADDWRRAIGTTSDSVTAFIGTARLQLAREVSRAFLAL